MSLCSKSIVIIGGGFCGTLLAVHLLRQARNPLRITLIDASKNQLGRGIAYSTNEDIHLLNVPASMMSAFPDQPNHFLDWAKRYTASIPNPFWVTNIDAAAFVPRRVYGDYLCWLLDQAEIQSAPGVELERQIGEVVKIDVLANSVAVKTSKGERISGQKVILALGNFRPSNPIVDDPSFYLSLKYQGDPWVPGSLADVAETESCLLIGTGLTMVDWAIALFEKKYSGTIHVISRRGLWPKVHKQVKALVFKDDLLPSPLSVRAWLHQLHNSIRQLEKDGYDWRAVIDSFRLQNQDLWLSLPHTERRRFLRHIRHYWDCHRHRIAPVVEEKLNTLVHSRQLIRHIGRIRAYHELNQKIEVEIQQRGTGLVDTLKVDTVVNCSGSENDYRKVNSDLVRNLLNQGIARPDPLFLGLDADEEGALLNAEGIPAKNVFTLGPPKKGVLWETTAVPEIRVQAERLAHFLLR